MIFIFILCPFCPVFAVHTQIMMTKYMNKMNLKIAFTKVYIIVREILAPVIVTSLKKKRIHLFILICILFFKDRKESVTPITLRLLGL